jgi:hypothetical protein
MPLIRMASARILRDAESKISETLSPRHGASPADGGRLPIMEGGCEYIEYEVAYIRQGVVLQFEFWNEA